jgi:redox-sensitive bicupin YhaK (pirin superfamily)
LERQEKDMSWMPTQEPECHEQVTNAIDLVIEGKPRDLGEITVRRALPSMARRMIGPFIFFDHMGPVTFAPGQGIDVRPHPHIGLATVTYLFEGEIVHRDSVGSYQAIRPGDVNWMTAGRGIAHSERTAPERRAGGAKLHGIQLWVALPKAHEETEPSFRHHAASSVPVVREPGLELRVIIGRAYGQTSPVEVFSPMFYVGATLDAEATLVLPDEYPQRAAYVAEGTVSCDGADYGTGAMLVFHPGARAVVRAKEASRVMLLGGEAIDGERHIWWNFVSSSKGRIEQAKADWREGRFGKVTGDETELIPLPESR